MKSKIARPKIFRGIIASPGIAIGRAYVMDRFHICVIQHRLEEGKVQEEVERFEAALEATKADMIEATEKNLKKAGKNISYILNPHIQLLSDPTLVDQTRLTIQRESVNAEWALKKTYDKLSSRFQKIKDPYFKERVHDIELVVNRVMQRMMGTSQESMDSLSEQVIVFAHDLTPLDTAQMASQNILGFVTEVGGKTSHTGIIASSLQIPAVVGVPRITGAVQTGDQVILDAIDGRIVLNPSEDQFKLYNRNRQKFLYMGKELESHPELPAETKDHTIVRLMVNLETSNDIRSAISLGAEGVGLYRTEFLFLRDGKFPSEEDQFQDYKMVAESVAPNEAVIRTLDLGGDKIPSEYEEEPEANPALGLRAIRYCLRNPKIFSAQLRAILRASHYGRVKIMYPMIVGLEEIRKANRILERQKRMLTAAGIPFDTDIEVGMMVETPSAALMLHQYVPYVDFFSIGTNDLIQYMLAIDRGNEKVANLYQPLHPAVLRMLWMTIRTANDYGVPVSICGQMSADPVYAFILIGMGDIANLSMDSHSIPKIKKFIRTVSIEDARNHVHRIMDFSSTRDIKKYLLDNVSHLLPDGMFSEVSVHTYGTGQSL